MAGFYPYLVSSLPMLYFGIKPPFSWEGFINYCQRFIPEDDVKMLKKSSISGEYVYKGSHPTLKKWQDFDTGLRNELVKIRASHKRIAPAQYIRGQETTESSIVHIAMNVHRTPHLLEAEKVLDLERWWFLDEISFGHYFDIDILLIYSLKLLILERWESINSADKKKVLEETLI